MRIQLRHHSHRHLLIAGFFHQLGALSVSLHPTEFQIVCSIVRRPNRDHSDTVYTVCVHLVKQAINRVLISVCYMLPLCSDSYHSTRILMISSVQVCCQELVFSFFFIVCFRSALAASLSVLIFNIIDN